MKILQAIVSASWLFLIIYWIVSARGAKKNLEGKNTWARGALLRFVLAIVIISAVSLHLPFLDAMFRFFQPTLYSAALGSVLCLAGVTFAAWARYKLGRNWSSYPAAKEHPELVTDGPYKIVRHPIYTGVMTGALGSALAIGFSWLLIFIFISAVFVSRLALEENIVEGAFPEAYAQYKRKTPWQLIPGIW
jgi:protein-S-isoprenylcysteine O-methyltransferase Ste14